MGLIPRWVCKEWLAKALVLVLHVVSVTLCVQVFIVSHRTVMGTMTTWVHLSSTRLPCLQNTHLSRPIERNMNTVRSTNHYMTLTLTSRIRWISTQDTSMSRHHRTMSSTLPRALQAMCPGAVAPSVRLTSQRTRMEDDSSLRQKHGGKVTR